MVSSQTLQYFKGILDYFSDEEMVRLSCFLEAQNPSEEELFTVLFQDFDVIEKQYKNNPFVLASKQGIQWGDILMHAPKAEAAKKTCLEEDWDWTMPDLRLRKHIWEHFPVVVDRIQSIDSTESYAVVWNRKQFNEQFEARPTWQIPEDFENDTYRRLIKTLNAASRYWTVQAPRNEKELCVIVMNFNDEQTSKFNDAISAVTEKVEKRDERLVDVHDVNKSKNSEWHTVGYTGPVLCRLNDIKTYFPVVWNAVETKNSNVKIYSIALFQKKILQDGLKVKAVQDNLMNALKHSKYWTVLPASSDKDVCCIQMNRA